LLFETKGNYLIKILQCNSKQQLDMAAVNGLNVSATDVQVGINLFGKKNNHITLDELELTKLLDNSLQLFNC
jgi:hypothetical protein